MAKKRKLRIVEKKLGRQKAWGLCYMGEDLIELESRMKSKMYLSTLVHELLHYTFPWMSESMVTRAAPKIARVIWQQKYRKIKE